MRFCFVLSLAPRLDLEFSFHLTGHRAKAAVLMKELDKLKLHQYHTPVIGTLFPGLMV